MGLEQVTGPEVYHGEGPAWYPGWGGLRFVDSMLAGDIISLALTAPSNVAMSDR